MLLITTFVELRVVDGRSRRRASSPQAVSRRTCCAVALRRMAWSEHGMGMACKCESDTAALCKSNGKDTINQPLAVRHGRGTAWARHGHGMSTAWVRYGHGIGTTLARHGHGMSTAWARHGYGMGTKLARHGHGMVFVNRP